MCLQHFFSKTFRIINLTEEKANKSKLFNENLKDFLVKIFCFKHIVKRTFLAGNNHLTANSKSENHSLQVFNLNPQI